MAGRREGTALGVARARFVDGLPRKAQELKGAIALLAGTPEADRPREEMRRRLHALYASAQVFRIQPLADALKEGIQRLDGARDRGGPLAQDDLDALANIAATLPGLANDVKEQTGPSVSGPPDAGPTTAIGRIPLAKVPASQASPLPPPPSEDSAKPQSVPAAPPPPRSTPPKRRSIPSLPSPSSRLPSGTFTAASGSRRPRSRPPTMPGEPLETVVSVLVVDRSQSQAQIRAALPTERYEVLAAASPEEALRLARSGAPDVVLADADIALRDESDLIARLRSDPLTDFVPVVLMHPAGTTVDVVALREHGADAVLAKPPSPTELSSVVARLTGLAGTGPMEDAVGDATIEEVAARLAEEIRRGLVDAAAKGKELKIPLGEGSELLAAAWSTIARVRAQLAERSGGKVRFRDAVRRGGPAFMSLVDDDAQPPQDDAASDVSLEGRRVVVADDDPAVVWFFAGLLREEGAIVDEVENGAEALESARAQRPDVILSDILMPALDGLALCREIQRDPALSEIPVILLSWKEDFLQRMRELKSGASGYLRKEAASGQILAKVREVLRPRVRLEQQLRAGGEVRGRVEGVGVLEILRSAAKDCPDARVTVRDAWNLFEIDMRGGQLLDVTRTATDGSFARGRRALPQLLGVSAGRFTVAESVTPVRASLSGNLDTLLEKAVEELGALVDSVSGKRLSKIAELRFDDDVLSAFLRTSTQETQDLVEQLHQGERPTELLVQGQVGPQVLEGTLVDLARRGAITGVVGDRGDDLVAEAVTERGGRRPSAPDWLTEVDEPGASPPSRPEPPVELAKPRLELAELPLDPLGDEGGGDLGLEFDDDVIDPVRDELLRSPTNPPPAPPEPKEPEAAATEPGMPAPSSLAESLQELGPALVLGNTPIDEPGSAEATISDAEPAGAADDEDQDFEEDDEDESESVDNEEDEDEDEDEDSEDDDADEAEEEEPDDEPAVDDSDDEELDDDELDDDEEVDEDDAPATIADEAGPPPPMPQDAGIGRWILMTILLFGAGYVGWRVLRAEPVPQDSPVVVEPLPPPTQPNVDPEPTPSPREVVAPNPVVAPEPSLSYGENVPRIVDAGVAVQPNQGLLLVQSPRDGVETRVYLGGGADGNERELGTAPVGIALPEGRYELIYRRGSDEKFRYVFVQSAHTRIVAPGQAP